MLAPPHRRQHLPPNTTTSTLPSPPESQLSFDQLSQQLSTQDFFNRKFVTDYLEAQQQQQQVAAPVIVDSDLSSQANPFMTNAYDFNPTIRIQQSTPTPQLQTDFSQSSMLPANSATATGLDSWTTFANNATMDNQSLHTPIQNRAVRTHQRASSSSSIASSGSQYQAVGSATGYPAFSNHHLPTPTHTPTHDSFYHSNINNFTSSAGPIDSTTMAAHLSLKQALMDQHVPEEDVPGFGHSARHSVSSYGHDSPATPHTSHGDDYDDRFKMPPSATNTVKRGGSTEDHLTQGRATGVSGG
ncbi:hypothetical protein EJ04DRAFT_163660 [Polyplosphaeria fusca]|uniref:Uncharacterized protein n=1 Tax=Polyplosphaeria fusca TaxID=682080 RepID=A0A9P4RB44_9PLEO|nr:hypothetical protein EJ04DRAFT_163660 [Polyplosphaeria fusca]